MSLPKDRRWDLVALWLLSSEMDGRLPIDCRYIAGRLGIYHVESVRHLLDYFESKGLISKEDVRGDSDQSSRKSVLQSKSKSIETEKEKNKKEKSVAKPATFVLPGWVPEESWNAYVEMRRQKKKPMTEYAMKLAVQKLEKLQNQGQDIEAVLNESVLRSWEGLFPIGGDFGRNGHSDHKETRTERLHRLVEEAVGDDSGDSDHAEPVRLEPGSHSGVPETPEEARLFSRESPRKIH